MRLPTLAGLLLAAMLLAPATSALGPAPRSVDLGAAATSLAMSGDGSLVVVGTADGVFAFRADGTQVFHALVGTAIRSVAADLRGDVVVAGDGAAHGAFVHFLRGDGSEFAMGLATATVNSVAVSDDGASAVAGSADNFVYAFRPAQPAPAPLNDLPANPANLLLPAWWYDTGNPVTSVLMTSDGEWVDAANAPQGHAWAFTQSDALLPGGSLVALGPFGVGLPCFSGFVSVKCWTWQMQGVGGLGAFSAARSTYDMLIGFSNAAFLTRANNYFVTDSVFYPAGSSTSGQMSADGTHSLVGDSLGNVYYEDHRLPHEGELLPPVWSAHLGARVSATAASTNGAVVAAADTTGSFAVWSGASNAPLFTGSLGAAPAGLALSPGGGSMAAAAGTHALFWT